MYCPHCGNALPEGATNCSHCGFYLGDRGKSMAPPDNNEVTPGAGEPAASLIHTTNDAVGPTRPATPTTHRRRKLLPIIAGLVAGIAAIVAMIVFTRSPGGLVVAEAFPDVELRTAIERYDTDSDGRLSPDELATVTWLDVKGAAIVTGIDVFPNLTEMHLAGEELVEVDLDGCVSLETLKVVEAPNLEAVDASPCSSLRQVDLMDTGVTEFVMPTAADWSNKEGAEGRAEETSSAEGDDGSLAPNRDVSFSLPPGTTIKGLEDTGLVAHALVTRFEMVEQYDGKDPFETRTVVSASYDADGRMTHKDLSRTNSAEVGDSWPLSQVSYDLSYDASGRLVQVSAATPGEQKEWKVTYDVDGLTADARMIGGGPSRYMVSRCEEGGRLIDSDFDISFGQFFSLGSLSLDYDESGRIAGVHQRVTGRSGGGETEATVDITPSYDSAKRLSEIHWDTTSGNVGAQNPSRVSYERDASGRLVSRQKVGVTLSGFDGYPIGSETHDFSYGADGRLSAGTSTYTSDGGQRSDKYSFEVDGSGNVIHASLQSADSRREKARIYLKEYTVSYVTVLVPAGTELTNAVYLYDALDPECYADIWAVRLSAYCPFDEIELIRAHQAWLERQPADTEAPATEASAAADSSGSESSSERDEAAVAEDEQAAHARLEEEARSAGRDVYSGTCRVLTGQEVLELQGRQDMGAYPDYENAVAASYALVLFEGDQDVTSVFAGSGEIMTNPVAMLCIGQDGRRPEGDVEAWRPYDGQKITVSVDPQDTLSPSDARLPLGIPHTDSAELLYVE